MNNIERWINIQEDKFWKPIIFFDTFIAMTIIILSSNKLINQFINHDTTYAVDVLMVILFFLFGIFLIIYCFEEYMRRTKKWK